MKRLKKFAALLAAAALCVLVPGANTLTASAAEPVTYYIRSIDGEWRFQATSTWDDTVQHRELYYMEQDIKDGDVIIIDGSLDNKPIKVNARLSNLTVKSSTSLVFTANGYDNCYVLDNNAAAINGDVSNAYVYGSSRCNFNNNVTNLEIIGSGNNLNNLNATVAVLGAVSHLKATDSGDGGVYYEYYDFAADKLRIEKGTLKTAESDYKKDSSNPEPQPPAQQTPAQESTTQQTPPAQNTSSDEYDDVPKTGESNLVFWLLGITAICVAGKFALRRA